MTTQIGQLRYTGSDCIEPVQLTSTYTSVVVNNSEESTSSSFQDITLLPVTGNFIKDQDYYLKISIPQDVNYDMSFNLKLTKIENNATTVYQFLRNVSITRGGTGQNVYKVVLYEKSDGGVEATIPKVYKTNVNNIVKDELYYDSATKRYYLGVTSTTYVRTTKVNELSVNATWKNESTANYGVFEITFRPVEDMFTGILIEMVRSAEDYSIQRTSSGGGTEFGRKIDITKLKYELYMINNLVNKINRGGTLQQIGVNGRPGLTMVINGEEIRIGPSAVYQLDVLPISSLGIVARDYNDNWTLDYTYNKNEE